MPTITVSLDNPAVSRSFTISGLHLARMLVKAVAERKGSIIQTPAVPAVPAVLNPDGSVKTPAIPAVPAVMRDPTNSEAFSFKVRDWLDDMANGALQAERAVVAKTASDAVAPINIT